jgi:hypothetical protein
LACKSLAVIDKVPVISLGEPPAAELSRSATLTHLVAVSLAWLFVGSASAATAAPSVTGTFSSLTYNEEGGDLLGTEITILYGAGEYYAVVQCSEGSPGPPLLLKARIADLKVSFTVPKGSRSGCPETTYTGTVSSEGLKGQFLDYGVPELLTRKKSYWQ